MGLCSHKRTKKATPLNSVSCREQDYKIGDAMDKWEQTAVQAWEAILSRVKALKDDGHTLQQIADIVGAKNRSLIGEWLNGNRGAANTSFPNLMNYLEKLGFNYQDFFPHDNHAVIKRIAPHAPLEVVEGNDLPQIPVMGATGAGNAVELFNASPERWINILPQYMRSDMIGLVVEGDSMEPTIHKGAIIGVIPYDGSINDGGIYLVQRPPFGRTIKRIKMGNGDQLVLHSDNPAYNPVTTTFEGYEEIIIGQVVWVWQLI